MNKQIDDFLSHATEGLRDDTELQLDVRAELASHAEEKLHELKDQGIGDEEALQQTVKALGDPIELAADLYEANRKRMNLRSQLRFFMRFALVPLVLLSTLWAANLDILLMTKLFNGKQPHLPLPHVIRKLSDENKFLITGDPSSKTEAEREKSIWESDPTNRVYFGNYFSAAMEKWQNDPGKTPEELLDTARKVDPENALYDYLEALKIMESQWSNKEAVRIISFTFGDALETAELPVYEVQDRERLDQAMALIEKALNEPLNQYHAEEMLRQRLSLLPEPKRMADQVAYIGYSAGCYRPPLHYQYFRKLPKFMMAYGDLLLQEGDNERAAVFLSCWEKMPRQILDGKAGNLIDTMIAMVLIKTGYSAAAIYRAHGFAEEAKQIAAKVDIARAPNLHWNAERENKNYRPMLEKHGSMLALIGVSNIGSPLSPEELSPSRRLEYAVLSEGIAALISITLLLAILGCTIVSLRWRFTKKGRAIPVLLAPDFSTLLQILTFGVILPGLLFLLITRLAPWSGHAYSYRFGLHKLISEFGLLIMAMLILPAILGGKAVRNRCTELDIPSTPLAIRRLNPAFLICAVALVAFWFVPANSSEMCFWSSIILAGVIAILLLSGALGGMAQGVAGRKEYGLYYGSLFRSLIPLLAGTSLLLNVMSRPTLFTLEKEYIQADTLVDALSPACFTIENKVSKQLGEETLAALKEAKSMP